MYVWSVSYLSSQPFSHGVTHLIGEGHIPGGKDSYDVVVLKRFILLLGLVGLSVLGAGMVKAEDEGQSFDFNRAFKFDANCRWAVGIWVNGTVRKDWYVADFPNEPITLDYGAYLFYDGAKWDSEYDSAWSSALENFEATNGRRPTKYENVALMEELELAKSQEKFELGGCDVVGNPDFDWDSFTGIKRLIVTKLKTGEVVRQLVLFDIDGNGTYELTKDTYSQIRTKVGASRVSPYLVRMKWKSPNGWLVGQVKICSNCNRDLLDNVPPIVGSAKISGVSKKEMVPAALQRLVTLTASDPPDAFGSQAGSGVRKIQLGSGVKEVTKTSAVYTFSRSINTSLPNKLWVRVRDAAGNWSRWKMVKGS